MTQPTNPAPSGRWMFAIPGGLALVLVALGVMVAAIARYGEARKSWPSTTGTVTGSGVRQELYQDKDGYWNKYDETGVRYTVAGRTYSFTSRVYVGRSLSSANGTAGYASHYHTNESVRVFYNPDDPSKGTITIDQTPSWILTLIAGICFVLSLPFWFFSGLMLWKSRRSNAKAAS